MNAATTAKVLRRRSLAVVDQLSYVPIARLTFNIMLNVLVSQQWLFAGVRPAADYLIARTTSVVPGVRVKRVSAPVRGEWVRAPEADDAAGVVLVLHGSGYLICSARTSRVRLASVRILRHAGFCHRLPARARASVSSGRGRCVRRISLAACAGT
jgi:epsilon-lactone hydrolase